MAVNKNTCIFVSRKERSNKAPLKKNKIITTQNLNTQELLDTQEWLDACSELLIEFEDFTYDDLSAITEYVNSQISATVLLSTEIVAFAITEVRNQWT